MGRALTVRARGGDRARIDLTPAGLLAVERLAAAGKTQATIAACLSISLRCFKEILSRDEPSRLAWEQGRAAVEQALFDVLFKAAKKGAVVPALFLTKTQFGWREGDVVDQRANLVVMLPGAATPEQYAKVIDALPNTPQLPAPEPEPKTKRTTTGGVMR